MLATLFGALLLGLLQLPLRSYALEERVKLGNRTIDRVSEIGRICSACGERVEGTEGLWRGRVGRLEEVLRSHATDGVVSI